MMVPAAFCIAGDMISAIGGVVAVRIARTQYEEHGLLEFSSSLPTRVLLLAQLNFVYFRSLAVYMFC